MQDPLKLARRRATQKEYQRKRRQDAATHEKDLAVRREREKSPEHKAKRRASRSAWDYHNGGHYVSNHGVSREVVAEALSKRGTTCDCCGRTTQKLEFDHCHDTKTFRGWLCRQCNTGIGLLGDNAAGLEQALKYLQK
jgi:hypothetical protein